MLYQVDEETTSNFVSSAVCSLLQLPTMASHRADVPIPSLVKDVPPDPPPPSAPPDPPTIPLALPRCSTPVRANPLISSPDPLSRGINPNVRTQRHGIPNSLHLSNGSGGSQQGDWGSMNLLASCILHEIRCSLSPGCNTPSHKATRGPLGWEGAQGVFFFFLFSLFLFYFLFVFLYFLISYFLFFVSFIYLFLFLFFIFYFFCFLFLFIFSCCFSFYFFQILFSSSFIFLISLLFLFLFIYLFFIFYFIFSIFIFKYF
jgi:hypothetical protein